MGAPFPKLPPGARWCDLDMTQKEALFAANEHIARRAQANPNQMIVEPIRTAPTLKPTFVSRDAKPDWVRRHLRDMTPAQRAALSPKVIAHLEKYPHLTAAVPPPRKGSTPNNGGGPAAA
jgi:hypothetical protein